MLESTILLFDRDERLYYEKCNVVLNGVKEGLNMGNTQEGPVKVSAFEKCCTNVRCWVNEEKYIYPNTVVDGVKKC